VAAVGQAQVGALVGKHRAMALPMPPEAPVSRCDSALELVRHGFTRILIGLPSWRSSFSMPTLTSSRETMSLMERDRSSRPRDTSVASVSMSTFWYPRWPSTCFCVSPTYWLVQRWRLGTHPHTDQTPADRHTIEGLLERRLQADRVERHIEHPAAGDIGDLVSEPFVAGIDA